MANQDKETYTPLSELGEFELIQRLTRNFPLKQASSIVGVGDDAAVLENLHQQTVVTNDILVEGVHFDLMYMAPAHLGFKAITVNISDIVAMNARPTQVMVSMAISNRFGVEYIEKIYEGIRAACEHYEVDLIGGDTTSSYSGLMISVTAFGEAPEEEIVKRSTAQETDLLVVSGDLGGAYMGLQILNREKEVFKETGAQPKLEGHEYVLQRQLAPQARIDVTKTLADMAVKPTAMIDISDGLSSEVLHLCQSSNLGAHLYESKIPIDPAVYKLCEELNLNTTTVALNGGEDYEVLFTVSVHDHKKMETNPHFTIIGHMTRVEDGAHLITRDEQAIEIKAQGWNGFPMQE